MFIQRFAVATLMAASVSAPLVMADEHVKIYVDKAHKDKHTWDANEDRNYATFRTEKHIPEHDFARAKRSEQQQYWNWRHEHPDNR